MKQHIKKIHEHVFFKRFHIGHLFIAVLVQILVISVILFTYSKSVRSDSSFNVNSTNDAVDINQGDGICATSAGECTLRAAIQESTSLTGTETINIPAGTYLLTAGTLTITSSVNLVGENARTTIIDGNGNYRVFFTSSGTVSFNNITISRGLSTQGGAILNTANLILTDVIVENNTSTSGFIALGGGIFSYQGSLTLTNTLINNNTVSGDYAIGGGLNISNSSTLNATNVTISGNSAFNSSGELAQGGGLYISTSGLVTLTNVTIDGNTVNGTGDEGAGIYIADGITAETKNTILSNNTGGNCALIGTFNSLGNNLSSDTSCSGSFNQTGDQNNVNPLLSALANNGGNTNTMAIVVGSPALDSGTNSGCPATDQRGILRPYNLTCDIGAFEYFVDPTNTPSPTHTPTPTPGPSTTPTPGAPKCEPPPPSLPPDLYEITVSSTEATLQLSPAGKPYTGYVVTYGFSSGDERFGAETTQTEVNGSIRYKIMQLDSNRVYYFRVRGQNICQPGPWSEWLGARTTADNSTFVFTKYNQSEIVVRHGSTTVTIINPTATPTITNKLTTPTPTPTVRIIVPEPTVKILTVTPIKNTSPTPTPYLIPDPPRPKVSENIIEQTRSFIAVSVLKPLITFFQSFFQ